MLQPTIRATNVPTDPPRQRFLMLQHQEPTSHKAGMQDLNAHLHGPITDV